MISDWTWNSYAFVVVGGGGVSYLLNSFLGFEIFVSRILVAVNLHVGYVSLLWGDCLIDFNKSLQ